MKWKWSKVFMPGRKPFGETRPASSQRGKGKKKKKVEVAEGEEIGRQADKEKGRVRNRGNERRTVDEI